MHRLTSIVEEKDLAAAKEMFKGMDIQNGNVALEPPATPTEHSPNPPVELTA